MQNIQTVCKIFKLFVKLWKPIEVSQAADFGDMLKFIDSENLKTWVVAISLQNWSYSKTVDFSRWFLEKCKDKSFLSHLLMSDEAHVYLQGHLNKQNCRISTSITRTSTSWLSHDCLVQCNNVWNVWPKTGDCVTVTGKPYKEMMERVVSARLKEIKWLRRLWF